LLVSAGAPSLTALRRGAGAATRSPSRADRRLAARLRRRDPQALRDLHAELGAHVFGFLRHALGDRGAAEDVMQQVFLEVWQRGPDYDPRRGSPLSWVMTIARSRAIDHLRRRIPEPRDPTGADERRSDSELDELLERWRLAALLGNLPRQEADVLRRRFYEGRSQAEIAADTGVPLGTVKSRMVAGLARLREALDREEQVA
jgi:RNA polymerase sigma-70 factor, ECF subfamily